MEIRVAERLIVVRGRCWVSYPEAASIKKKKTSLLCAQPTHRLHISILLRVLAFSSGSLR